MTDRLRYTRAEILAEGRWKPPAPVYCDGCGERLKRCSCAKPYVSRKRDDDLDWSTWMK